MKCKPYSEITVEIRTQLKTVKITSNIFAVQVITIFGQKLDIQIIVAQMTPFCFMVRKPVKPGFWNWDSLFFPLTSGYSLSE